MGWSFFISSEENKFLNQVSESNRISFRIQPGKFPNPTGKVSESIRKSFRIQVSESTRKSFRIQVSESNRKSFRIQPGKFPNPTGKVSESTRKSFRIQVSESTRKSFRRQRFSYQIPVARIHKFPNTTGKVSESNRKVSESTRKSFRIHREKFPNTSFRIQPEKFPNTTVTNVLLFEDINAVVNGAFFFESQKCPERGRLNSPLWESTISCWRINRQSSACTSYHENV